MDAQTGNSGLNLNCISDKDFKKLIELMSTIKYGSVTLIIQDGKVIQIDKNEKLRLK